MAAPAVQGAAGQCAQPAQAPAKAGRSTPTERSSIVIAGCEAHVCLMQTALDLLEDEFEVWVVTDACSSRTERNRDAAFDRLAGAGAELVTTEMVAFEWLAQCRGAAVQGGAGFDQIGRGACPGAAQAGSDNLPLV